MRAVRIAGADPKPLGAPPDWNERSDGHCSALFVRREQIGGVGYMRSAWEVEASEAAFLLAGAKLTLGIAGEQHPVVQLGVDALPPDFEPIVTARRYTDATGAACVYVEMLFPHEGGQRAYSKVQIAHTFADAVALGVKQIEDYARAHGWTPAPTKED
ncbi:MAG: hypothetical protein CMK98_02945 [Pseudomonas sp.]|nr:hypothetical protein [Pseudomonas sp.]MBS67320.1 hypothetical protein [Pseudomonas sp.]|tara:strand:- start:1268 stop:1741 length:474 start_codon:yes stop_codon:yes gene_type:complete